MFVDVSRGRVNLVEFVPQTDWLGDGKPIGNVGVIRSGS
jgi:hypothetical protein